MKKLEYVGGLLIRAISLDPLDGTERKDMYRGGVCKKIKTCRGSAKEIYRGSTNFSIPAPQDLKWNSPEGQT